MVFILFIVIYNKVCIVLEVHMVLMIVFIDTDGNNDTNLIPKAPKLNMSILHMVAGGSTQVLLPKLMALRACLGLGFYLNPQITYLLKDLYK